MNADRTWQQAIVERARHCERCHTTQGLTGHHYISRRYHKTRHDIKNGICLCIVCHAWAHSRPSLASTFCEVIMLLRGDFRNTEELHRWVRVAKYPKDKRLK